MAALSASAGEIAVKAGGIELQLVHIPAGEFQMGSDKDTEGPRHQVRVAAFDLGGDDHPVVALSWNDAAEFTKWLSREKKQEYRLPNEAEWECSRAVPGRSAESGSRGVASRELG